MKAKTYRPYRLEIMPTDGNHPTYITRHTNGHVNYISASEQSLCLSNLMGNRAAVSRFALQDALDGNQAAAALRAQAAQRGPNVGFTVSVI
jgi:hypothetical protein